MDIFIQNELSLLECQIYQCEELKQILINKDINHPKFKEYRRKYIGKLSDKIPRRLGGGFSDKRFLQLRQEQINLNKILIKEFDEYFNYTEN